VLVQAYLRIWRPERTFASLAMPLLAIDVVLAGVLWAMLYAEEVRLARELRTARTGSSAIRSMVAGRRRTGSALSRLVSTRLGTAAILLAEGDRTDALDALSGGSPLMRGGRLDALRAVVEADLERATGTPAALARSVERLRAMAPIGNREADLYRTHVLVKALLEGGDAEGGVSLGEALRASDDEEARVYLVWLGTWFELEEDPARDPPWPAPSEGELRVAALLARAHGAEKLVERLDERVAAIARSVERK
jgi:hypothetical protein